MVYALTSTGYVYAWGQNTNGECGIGTTANQLYATQVLTAASTPLTGVTSISAGSLTGYALTNTGTVYAWGQNTNGQCGIGTTTNQLYATQVLTATSTPLTGVTSISKGYVAGAVTGYALTNTGVYAWGANTTGGCGIGTTANQLYATQVLTAASTPLTGVTSISAGSTAYALTNTGVYAWGQNTNGECGIGTTANQLYATQVLTAASTPLTSVASIWAGYKSCYALTQGTGVYAWGLNTSGECGIGTTANQLYATQVLTATSTPLTGVASISTGQRGVCYALTQGTGVYAWGANTFGECGNGTTTNQLYAKQVLTATSTPLTGVTSISTGYQTCTALTNTGVYAWGFNYYGQCGNGTTTNQLYAKQVLTATSTPLTSVASISAGYVSCYALTSTGYVYAWGGNTNGECGNGTTTNQLYAAQIPSLTL